MDGCCLLKRHLTCTSGSESGVSSFERILDLWAGGCQRKQQNASKFCWDKLRYSEKVISPSSKGDHVLLYILFRASSGVVAAETLASPVFPQYIGQRDCADWS